MNQITSNRNYYRVTPQGQVPVTILTTHFSPVLGALLQESDQSHCHFRIQRIITTEPFNLEGHENVTIQLLNPKKFLNKDNYIQTLKHSLVDESPEIIALIDTDAMHFSEITQHFRGRIIHYYWQAPQNTQSWLSFPLSSKRKSKNYQLIIEFIGEPQKKHHPICYVDFNHKDQPTEAQANSIACQAYTAILDWIGDQRIVLDKGSVYFDGKVLPKTGMLYAL